MRHLSPLGQLMWVTGVLSWTFLIGVALWILSCGLAELARKAHQRRAAKVLIYETERVLRHTGGSL